MAQPSRIVVHPPGGAVTASTTAVTSSPKPATPTKSIVATPLTPGQAIPPSSTVFISGGKTYFIPKATMTQAVTQQQPATQTTPALPMSPVPPQQLQQQPNTQTAPNDTVQVQQPTTPTIGTVQAQSASGQKQNVHNKKLSSTSLHDLTTSPILNMPTKRRRPPQESPVRKRRRASKKLYNYD